MDFLVILSCGCSLIDDDFSPVLRKHWANKAIRIIANRCPLIDDEWVVLWWSDCSKGVSWWQRYTVISLIVFSPQIYKKCILPFSIINLETSRKHFSNEFQSSSSCFNRGSFIALKKIGTIMEAMGSVCAGAKSSRLFSAMRYIRLDSVKTNAPECKL